MKDTISKEAYIQTTYHILSEEGIEAVSIRRLGKELECNTANLYRYFDSLEELLLYASLKYLSGYLKDVDYYFRNTSDSLKLHFQVWECFATYSFSNPEVFNNLFFGKYSNKLDKIMIEYYSIFFKEVETLNEHLKAVFTTGDFYFRDYLMLSQCVLDGWFFKEDAKLLNKICINLYKGYLKTVLDQKITGTQAEEMKNDFMYCLRNILNKYIISSH